MARDGGGGAISLAARSPGPRGGALCAAEAPYVAGCPGWCLIGGINKGGVLWCLLDHDKERMFLDWKHTNKNA